MFTLRFFKSSVSNSTSPYMFRCPAPRPVYFTGTFLPRALVRTPRNLMSSSIGSASDVSESRSISMRSSSTLRAIRNLPDVASNRNVERPSAPPCQSRKIVAAAASVPCPHSGASSSVVNQRMPNFEVFVAQLPERSTVFSSDARGVMNTVIGWFKVAAIVCSVSSGSAVSEGKCTIAAGLPPPSRSVNAFSMLKGSVWERALIVIARKLFEYSGVTVCGYGYGWDGVICVCFWSFFYGLFMQRTRTRRQIEWWMVDDSDETYCTWDSESPQVRLAFRKIPVRMLYALVTTLGLHNRVNVH